MRRLALAARDTPWTMALALLAFVSLTAGVLLSLSAERSADLIKVATWAEEWLRGGHPYAELSQLVDYPPWALVVFAPMGPLAHSVALPPVWIVANLAFLAIVVKRLVTFAGDDDPQGRMRLALLIAACAASRTLGQFSIFSFACALVGVTGSPQSPRSPQDNDWVHACLLGLSLVKPQIGGVVWVWALCERRWRLAAKSLLVPAILFGVFCVRSGDAPMVVASQYLSVLTQLHGSAAMFVGHTEIVPWLLALVPGGAGLGAKFVAATLLLLPAVIGPAGSTGSARVRHAGGRERLEHLTLCGAASLLAMRHLSYDLILLFPLLVAWRAWPCSAEPRSRLERAAFLLLAGLLVLEPASWWRHFSNFSNFPWATATFEHVDRVLVASVWLLLAWRALIGRFGTGMFNSATIRRVVRS